MLEIKCKFHIVKIASKQFFYTNTLKTIEGNKFPMEVEQASNQA